MDLEFLAGVVGTLGCLSSIFLKFLVGRTFWRAFAATDEVEPLPRCIALLNAMIGICYSSVARVNVLLVANGINASMEIFCLCTYMVYAMRQQKIYTCKLLGFISVFGLPILLFTFSNYKIKSRAIGLGWIYLIVNICDCIVSHLASMLMAYRTKNNIVLPLIPSIVLIICGGLWSFYGYLSTNPFVLIPNIVLLGFGMGRTILYIKYRGGVNGAAVSSVELQRLV